MCDSLSHDVFNAKNLFSEAQEMNKLPEKMRKGLQKEGLTTVISSYPLKKGRKK
jgi:hypothetical protein